jgi:hypothetical protein
MAVHFRNFLTSNSQRSLHPDALEAAPMLRRITASSLDSEMPGSLSVARRQSNDGLRRRAITVTRRFCCEIFFARCDRDC